MSKRSQRKKHVFSYALYEPVAHRNHQWPLIQECGQKAKCRDCKAIWSLEGGFNRYGNMRKDGTFKKLPYCKYCQSAKLKKRNIVRTHIAREEARIA